VHLAPRTKHVRHTAGHRDFLTVTDLWLAPICHSTNTHPRFDIEARRSFGSLRSQQFAMSVHGLGIDLGSSKLVSAALPLGAGQQGYHLPVLVRNSLSNDATPTAVSFGAGFHRDLGEAASDTPASNAQNLVADFVPRIGLTGECALHGILLFRRPSSHPASFRRSIEQESGARSSYPPRMMTAQSAKMLGWSKCWRC
jgi:hypothetical protein